MTSTPPVAYRRDRRRGMSHVASFRRGEFGIHQILAAASPGDAITNVALEYRDVLRRVGPSEVFARHIAPSSAGEVRPLSEFGHDGSGGLLVYHASIGEPAVSAFLLSRPEPIVLVYHNITPAKYFDGIDDTFAELLVLGRLELESIRHRVTLAIADSKFNAEELHEIGYEDVRVIPPVVDPYRLVRMQPDRATLTHIDATFNTPMLLFVGQVLPHKRPDLLVKAMHVAATYFGVEARLLLVGQNRFARYADAVSAQIRELNLANVHVVGPVEDARLAAMFRRAIAFVTASEHEGFCVPVLEAMAFDVPVIARACAAIPETVADGGLLLPPWAGAELIAEAIARVIEDSALRRDLVTRGRNRLREFTEMDASVSMLAAISEVV
jgi:glycosyltransferase involved in cell wall biosynthesis